MTNKRFDAIAYDRYMGRWSQVLADPFIEFVGFDRNERWLDVGCGTGSLALRLAARARHAHIVGIDPTEDFVEHARSRAQTLSVTFDIGNAQSLPYPDQSFDKCASLLVLRFIRNVRPAIDEMLRVTRYGGTVAACVWDKAGMEMNSIFWQSAEELDPAVDWQRNAPGYCRGQLRSLWCASGLDHVEEKELVISLEFASFDDFWTPITAAQGPTSRYIEGLAPAHQDALRLRLREKVLKTGVDQKFKLRGTALAVRGIRPAKDSSA